MCSPFIAFAKDIVTEKYPNTMNYAKFAVSCLKQLHFYIKETSDLQCNDENIKMAEQLSFKQVNYHCAFPPRPTLLPVCWQAAGKLLKMVYGH